MAAASVVAHPNAAGKPLIRVSNVTKRFGGVTATRNVSFDVKPGHIKGIIGPNGAGKSTLLNCISGDIRPDEGSIRLEDRELAGMPSHGIAACGVARTFQILRLFNNNDATVLDNVMLGGHLRLKPSLWRSLLLARDSARRENVMRERAEELLQFVGLQGLTREKPANLPFGQQRYVELARALMLEPRVLLLDEPASGLNDSEAVVFGELLKRLQQTGITILLIEHDIKLVMRVTDEILVLQNGQRLADGPPEEVRQNPDVIKAYLGPTIEGGN